jgi:hypothetical protein
MPSADLVEGYLAEIARGYGVQWNTDPRPVGDGQLGDAQGLAVSGKPFFSRSADSLILIRKGL